jgi:hypothetical protein
VRITGLSVAGVGRFSGGVRVAGFGDGVNVLAAENEAGKSTLFRAVRACLFERHTSTNQTVRSLASEGSGLPAAVTLDFSHGGADYRLAKNFLRSASASLARGGVEIARGREADERTWELLGIDPGAGRSVDDAAFGILWVEQGKSFSVPEPSEAAANALNSAVHAEVGTLVGGERARGVLKALGDELATLLTAGGKAKAGGPLAEAIEREAAAAAMLKAAQERLAVLDAELSALAVRRTERDRLADPAIAAGLAGELAEARRLLRAGEAAGADVARCEAAAQRARAELDRALRRRDDLVERARRIDADARREAELVAATAPLDEEERAARTAVATARAAVSEIDVAAAADEARERALQRVGVALTRAGERDRLAERLDRLEQLAARLAETAAGLAANRAEASTVARLEAIERELAVTAARLEAAAPQVEIALGPGGAGRVRVDGAPLSADLKRAALAPLTIAIADLATVTVSPPSGAGAAEEARLQALRSDLAGLLDASGFADAAALRTARAGRQELEAERTALEGEAVAAGLGRRGAPSKGGAGDTAAAAVAAARDELAAIDALIAAAPLAEAGLSALPSTEALDARLDGLRAAREGARRRRQAHEGAIEAHGATLARVADARGRLAGALQEVRGRLAGDRAALPDAARVAMLAAAEAELRAAEEDHGTKAAALEAERRAAPPPEEIERRGTRVKRLDSAIANQAEALGRLDREIANLEGRIESAGGDGLGERADALEAEAALARRDRARLQERAETLRLLRETVAACFAEQHERLTAPLRRHLGPYLHDLFPAAEIALGDGFSVETLRRGGAAEAFQRLSDGTKEQIAVLVRLAMGAMLAERGEDVPIVLDDALVFSDDGRIAQMFDALNRAGQRQQVIVLTCRTRAFASLGGRMLTIEAAAAS